MRSVVASLLHKPKSWSALIMAAVVGIAACFGLARWLLGPTVPVYVVEQGDILQTVVASGHVETPLRVDVGAQVTGRVAAIPVAEGQSVSNRQLLIALEDSEANAAVAAARAAVLQDQARLQQIRDAALPVAAQALRRAQATSLNARAQYERIQELKTRNLASQADLDTAKMNLDVAESEMRSAQLQVDTNSPTGSDYRVAETSLQQSLASLTAAQARLAYTRITAPVDGTLIARDVERGDIVQPGKSLMVISPAGPTQLVVQIDEKNLAMLHLGQQAKASADAYPDRTFAATVVYINPGVDATRGSVEVKLGVPSAPAYLRQDMTVSLDIEVARRTHTLILNADGVHDSTTAAPWVTRVVRGRTQRQQVTLGARGTGRVEVLQGLQAGDRVVSATKQPVAEGARVRVSLPTAATAARP
jgi:HlyD family secretion protein